MDSLTKNSLVPPVFINLSQDDLIKWSVEKKEGIIAQNGALAVETGQRTGRSPKDRYIVDDHITHNTVDWGGINQRFLPQDFNHLWGLALQEMNQHPRFDSTLFVGADLIHRLKIKLSTNLAWHALFCQNLFINEDVTSGMEGAPDNVWTVMSPAYFTPDLTAYGRTGNAAIILDFTHKRILVCGTQYAGELKKSLFSVLNFLLTDQDVLPMHCAANIGKQGDVALFFGLSGTGKTTLSTDPNRLLIGDDEHGWGSKGVFNFEGGCYAKCSHLSKESEPLIWDAIGPGAVMENVILDPVTKIPDFKDNRLTENTRVAYPLSHIKNRASFGVNPHPKNVIFLTCDLFGVLPPVARLSRAQAAYYFLSGYTALVGSTEVGSQAAIKSTFSHCFGAPFFPRPAGVYADLLLKRLDETKATVYLVNTGWVGGGCGQGGRRLSIPVTRRLIAAILSKNFSSSFFDLFPYFNFEIPRAVEGVDSALLNPLLTWGDTTAYEGTVERLVSAFSKNFEQFNVSDDIKLSGPVI